MYTFCNIIYLPRWRISWFASWILFRPFDYQHLTRGWKNTVVNVLLIQWWLISISKLTWLQRQSIELVQLLVHYFRLKCHLGFHWKVISKKYLRISSVSPIIFEIRKIFKNDSTLRLPMAIIGSSPSANCQVVAFIWIWPFQRKPPHNKSSTFSL